MTTIAEDVQRGAALLDEVLPGWDQCIDLAGLDVATTFSCPLGQLFGAYGRGLKALPDESDVEKYGFFPRMRFVDIFDPDKYRAACEPLTREWRDLVVARRLAAVST